MKSLYVLILLMSTMLLLTYKLTGENQDYLGSQIYQFGNEFQAIGGVSEQFMLGMELFNLGLNVRYQNGQHDLNNGEEVFSGLRIAKKDIPDIEVMIVRSCNNEYYGHIISETTSIAGKKGRRLYCKGIRNILRTHGVIQENTNYTIGFKPYDTTRAPANFSH